MAKQLRALILAHAGEANLIRVTELSSGNADFNWAFAGVDIQDAQAHTMTPMVIPTLPAGTTSQTFFRGFSTDLRGSFFPPTSGPDDLVPLTNVDQASSLSDADRQAAFDGLVRIENPKLNSPDTTDCASCHLTTPTALLIAAPHFSLVESSNANAFRIDPALVPAADLAPVYDTSGSFNLHALSYVGQDLAINQRVVNETAAVVTYLGSLATP
jgi:hypothetical protein